MVVRGKGQDERHLGKTDLIVSMKEKRADSGNRATSVQGDGPESPHMLAVVLLNFIHEAQGAREWIGEAYSHRRQSLGESVGQEVENVSAPGETAAITARLARGKQLALPFVDIGLNLAANGLWCQL